MHASLSTAGEAVDIECSPRWVADVIAGCMLDQLRGPDVARSTMSVHVESERRAFPRPGWDPVMRGAWRRGDELIVENVCSSGFDVLVRSPGVATTFVFRWRPPVRRRPVSLLRARFELLARAVLLQYPALWLAGTRGRTPLHVSALSTGGFTPLVAGPGRIGKSTLVAAELADGATATADNICVSDGTTVWGLVEPLRVEGGAGRRMPHGRRERPLPHRVASLVPDHVVLLRRGEAPGVERCDADVALRALIGGTYMAGELRRYWGFAATMAAGTGVGPPHPLVCKTAEALTARLPCVEVALTPDRATRLASALSSRSLQREGAV